MNGDVTKVTMQVAELLARWRFWLLPRHSRREAFYSNFLRPLITRQIAGEIGTTGRQKIAEFGEQKSDVQVTRNCAADSSRVREILVLKLDHIGDFVISLPAVQQLRDEFKQAKLNLLCGSWNREIAQASGLFDRVDCLDLFPEVSGEFNGIRFDPQKLSALKLPRFDLALDLRVEPDTRFILGHIQSAFKAGFFATNMPADMKLVLPAIVLWDEASQGLHTRTLLMMLSSAVVTEFRAEQASHRHVRSIASAARFSPSLPQCAGPIVGLNAGAGSHVKEWPLERFILLVQRLIESLQATVVLFGSEHQGSQSRAIREAVPKDRVLDYTGRLSLVQFSTVVGNLDMYIGNDTGTTHIAASLGKPTICLFSERASFTRFQPTGKHVTTIRAGRRGMTSISVDDVYAEAKQTLQDVGNN